MNDKDKARANSEVAEAQAKPKRPRRSKFADRYTPIPASEVSPKVVWNRGAGRGHNAMYYSLGKNYKKTVNIATGAVEYFKLKDNAEAPIHPRTPKARTDVPGALPEEKPDPGKGKGPRYRLGVQCWYVHEGRWYLCEVIKRTPAPRSKMTIRPVTGRDSTREASWPFDGDLEFSPKSTWFDRLRPLRDRQP